ncbi:MAG: M48 family metalloprotease [Dechloromonas sp.]|nr:M48 family metalloprotease [Dechloromonas sp.]
MADLGLFATLILPLLAVVAFGRHCERGQEEASPEMLAKRRYQLSWVTTLTIFCQAMGIVTLLLHWWEHMATLDWLLSGMRDFVSLLAGTIGRPAAAAIVSIAGMIVIVMYYSLYSLPWLRLDRIAKGTLGRAVRTKQLRHTLRSSLAGVLPLILWIGVITPLASQFIVRGDVTTFALMLAVFLITLHSLSPWQVQLANPTERLPSEHPVTRMAFALCTQAGVGIDQVRVLKLGEMQVANALVAGLWPRLRRIYITDHMLDTFSIDEIRAILAHEVGHIRHRHLWWYLGFALGGVFIIPRLGEGLAQFDLLGDSVWTAVITFMLYWGVMFKVLSRRFERQADRFAVATTGDVVTFQSALERLADVNGMVKRYSKWDIFQTHPPITERVKALI